MVEVLIGVYFIFIFLLVSGVLYLLIMRNEKVQKRINYYLDIEKKYKTSNKDKEKIKREVNYVKHMTQFIRGKLSEQKYEKVDEFLKGAGITMAPEEYVMIRWFAAFMGAGILYILSGIALIGIFAAVVGYMMPKIWVKQKREKRIKSFNDGLPDMITTMIGSLKAGYSFVQALKVVSEECESPIKEEVAFMLKEMSYGVILEDALNGLYERMPSEDLELMIQAILIQRQVGGNLSMILETIVKTIRERNKLKRQVQALTAQGRLSGRVMGILPLVLGVAMFFLNRETMVAFVTNPIGQIMIGVGLVSGIIGFILVNKLTKIEV